MISIYKVSGILHLLVHYYIILNHWHHFAAVSYTHLDVYKRQAVLRVVFPFASTGAIGGGVFLLSDNQPATNILIYFELAKYFVKMKC